MLALRRALQHGIKHQRHSSLLASSSSLLEALPGCKSPCTLSTTQIPTMGALTQWFQQSMLFSSTKTVSFSSSSSTLSSQNNQRLIEPIWDLMPLSNGSKPVIPPKPLSSIKEGQNNNNGNMIQVQLPPGFDELDESTKKKFSVILDTGGKRRQPKLKPSIVKRRRMKLKTYIGTEKNIRQSPWKLNLLCQLVAKLPLEDALTQLEFCDKQKNKNLLKKVLLRTSNLADIRDGLQISQLQVAECFTTKGYMLKRVKPMGRGRAGVMHHKFSHIRLVLREIDFPLEIYQARSLNQKKKWIQHEQRAKQEYEAAKAKREEQKRLIQGGKSSNNENKTTTAST